MNYGFDKKGEISIFTVLQLPVFQLAFFLTTQRAIYL
jgi:hypothetical protein